MAEVITRNVRFWQETFQFVCRVLNLFEKATYDTGFHIFASASPGGVLVGPVSWLRLGQLSTQHASGCFSDIRFVLWSVLVTTLGMLSVRIPCLIAKTMDI